MIDQGFDEQCSNDERCRCPACREQQREAEEQAPSLREICDAEITKLCVCGSGLGRSDCYARLLARAARKAAS